MFQVFQAELVQSVGSVTNGIIMVLPQFIAAIVFVLALCWPAVARGNGESTALRARATAQLYNLDHEAALATFREAVAADPQDPAALRGLAIGLWLNISFRRGNMTVDDYLGGVTRQSAAGAPV